MNIPKLLTIAREVSLKADHPAHRLGCVLFDRRGRTLAVGANSAVKTHPVVASANPLKRLCAETAAILSVRHKHDLTDASILVYRETKDGKLAMSRPCETCFKIMKLFGIRKIFYTTIDGLKQEQI